MNRATSFPYLSQGERGLSAAPRVAQPISRRRRPQGVQSAGSVPAPPCSACPQHIWNRFQTMAVGCWGLHAALPARPLPRADAGRLFSGAPSETHPRNIFSIAFPLASSSINLSR